MENNIVTFLHIFSVFFYLTLTTPRRDMKGIFLLVYFIILHVYFQYKHGSMI